MVEERVELFPETGHTQGVMCEKEDRCNRVSLYVQRLFQLRTMDV
jgi:hypothetical protein